MHARFYAPDAHAPGSLVTLPREEAEHLVRVLRKKAGDRIHVFDGRGNAFEAAVERVAGAAVEVRIGAAVVPAAEPSVAVTLVQAVLKGDRMDDVVRDAVMIGVAGIRPVVTGRAETSLAALARGRRRERWARIAISSAKQCGRAVVPPVHAPVALAAAVDAIREMQVPNPAVMLVEPGSAADTMPLRELESARPREATVLVGPEGGWTSEEITAGAGVCRLVTLGARTLRADAMAIVGVAALFGIWGEY